MENKVVGQSYEAIIIAFQRNDNAWISSPSTRVTQGFFDCLGARVIVSNFDESLLVIWLQLAKLGEL